MLEWVAIFSGIEKVFLLAVGIIGFLIKRELAAAARQNAHLQETIEKVLEQTTVTNGRVGKLEEWRNNHEKATTDVHESIRGWVRSLEERVNRYFDHYFRGRGPE